MGSVFYHSLELFDKSIVLRVHTVLEASSLSWLEKSYDLSGVMFEELVELDSSVNLLLEWLSFSGLTCGVWCFRHLYLTGESYNNNNPCHHTRWFQINSSN
jgi:hypothetical protein